MPVSFDPFEYSKDQREHPDKFFTLRSLVADVEAIRRIKHALTLSEVNKAFQGPAKAAKAAQDDLLLELLTAAAKQRKIELTKE